MSPVEHEALYIRWTSLAKVRMAILIVRQIHADQDQVTPIITALEELESQLEEHIQED